MLGWFAAAGVKPVRTDMLGGGELTVKLWLGRRELETQTLEAAA